MKFCKEDDPDVSPSKTTNPCIGNLFRESIPGKVKLLLDNEQREDMTENVACLRDLQLEFPYGQDNVIRLEGKEFFENRLLHSSKTKKGKTAISGAAFRGIR